MATKLDFSLTDSFFLVPSSVVNKYINIATHLELRVLLYLLNNPLKTDVVDASEALALSEGEIYSALEEWIKRGVLQAKEETIALTVPKAELVLSNPIKKASRPSYSFAQIDKALDENQTLRSVLQSAQTILGRSFSQTEYEILYSINDFYGISPEAMMLLFSHCAKIGKTSAKTIESLAILWHKNSITKAEDAERFIEDFNKKSSAQHSVKKIFGISDRKLTPKEQGYIKRWTLDFDFSEDLIEFAYNKCVDSIGKFTFSYIDKIMESYYLAGVTTCEAAQALPAPSTKKTKSKKEPEREASFDLDSFSDWAFKSAYGDLVKKEEN